MPSALCLMFTPWLLDRALAWAAVITVLSIVGMLMLLKRHALTNRRLALFGLFYLVFGAGLFVIGV